MTRYHLFHSPGACSLAVLIALEEIGEPFKVTHIFVEKGETLRDAYLSINKKARVPALAVNAGLLTEATAILQFLSRAHSDVFVQLDPWPNARMAEWLSWLSSELHPAFAQIWRPGRSTCEEECQTSVARKGTENVQSIFQLIEARLADRDDIAWMARTILQPYILVFYLWGRSIKLDMRLLSNWTELATQIMHRPAVQRALNVDRVALLDSP